MGYIDGTSAIEMLDSVFEVLEGGKSVEAAKVTELIADNGSKIADITSYTTNAANGAAAEVAEVVNIETGAAAGTTTGAGILATDVGLAGAAIAPALGLIAGVGLYALAPEFWTNVSDKLMDAGATVKGKVIGFIDADGNTSFPENVIGIFKDAFINAGLFSSGGISSVNPVILQNPDIANYMPFYTTIANGDNGFETGGVTVRPIATSTASLYFFKNNDSFWGYMLNWVILSDLPFQYNVIGDVSNLYQSLAYTYNNKTLYYAKSNFSGGTNPIQEYGKVDLNEVGDIIIQEIPLIDWWNLFFNGIEIAPPIQEGATYPEPGVEFPQTYPEWEPATFPEPLPLEIPDTYPVSLPEPDITQDPAQSGENANESQQDQLLNIFYNTLPDPTPHILPDTDPTIEPEPEPTPEPKPAENPIDPNPDPPPSGLTPTLPTLQTTSASRMFTVYNPTDGQVNSLGAFLWTSNIIEQIKKMWDNPMDGIISFHKIYGAPVTGSTKNIIMGYIDSGVSALEVTSQFTDVDCGTVTVPERLHNATDYSPFTSIHLYLPFIGIVEIDTNEVMNAELHIKYRIDVYTGTCVALIYARRDADMPNEQIIYTFSGNASQKLPLTAADFSGAIGALLGLAGAGVAVASGGALGVAAGALGAAHSLTSEMVHVQHSGGLSANAGILSPRKPFMILSRQYGYDANGYSGFYGYPANKTVYIGNCNGYIKCKEVIFRGSCTEEEVNEIISLLKGGVYL